MKIYFFLILAFFIVGCSSTTGSSVVAPPVPYNEVYYRFEKGLILPNRYYLTVVNHSGKTVAFFTQRNSNFLTLANGKNIPIVHPVGLLDYMDKGIFFISSGMKASLSFDIPKSEIRQAVMITFKGHTEIKAQDSIPYWQPDRQLIVTYNVRTKEFLVKEDSLPVQENVFDILNNRKTDPLGPIDPNDFKMRSEVPTSGSYNYF